MAGSQHSFDALLGRFKNGNTLIQSWVDYDPNTLLIKKATIPVFIGTVEAANTTVGNAEVALGNKRTARHALVFKVEDTNPLCMESRIQQIYEYIKGDVGENEQATKKVHSILKKFHPHYKKKEPGAPRGAGVSQSEKSFASAVGNLQTVIDIVTGLGAAYTPADNSLKAPALTTLLTDIKNANKAVMETLDTYGKANRARKKLYTGTDGMKTQEVKIKGYLVSFSGGKKSDHYKEYTQALRGT